ncbi:MAG: DMT family transporter [Phycisphaerales bacterium]
MAKRPLGPSIGHHLRMPAETTAVWPLLGEAAALGAAGCWVMTAMMFAIAGRRLGATAVNLLRIALALGMLLVIVRLRFGAWFPPIPASMSRTLMLSGVIGLAVGDQLLFVALVRIGPRLATLIATTLAPPLAAIIALPALGERLGIVQVAAMGVVLVGIAIVVLERAPSRAAGRAAGRAAADDGRGAGDSPTVPTDEAAAETASGGHDVPGLLGAVGGGVCQAVGLVLSKIGMGAGDASVDVDPWIATLYRMSAALPAIMILAVLVRRRMATDGAAGPGAIRGPDDRRVRRQAIIALIIGAIFGPVVGVWCSMVAVNFTEAGIAATLMATTPILILPVAVLVDGERLSPRTILGSLLAVTGVAMLSLARPAADPAAGSESTEPPPAEREPAPAPAPAPAGQEPSDARS